MKKKSKKRIPQDVKPWAKVSKGSESELFWVSGRKTVRWVSGDRRAWATKVLTKSTSFEQSKLFLDYLAQHTGANKAGDMFATYQLLQQKLNWRSYRLNKLAMDGKYKNFCLFSGRMRTFNRSLFIARHNLRKLAGVGLISGLIK